VSETWVKVGSYDATISVFKKGDKVLFEVTCKGALLDEFTMPLDKAIKDGWVKE